MFLDCENLTTPELYKLLVGGVLPRPIAWVSSKDENGVTNLAPYSFFTVASCNPPVLSLTHVKPADRVAKDTFMNLHITGECVVNIVSEAQAEQMNSTAANYAPEVSEFDVVGVEPIKSELVNVVGVKASKVRYECTLRELVTVGGDATMILLDVKGVYVANELYSEQGIDAKALQVIGKLGGDEYINTQNQFSMLRPKL